MLQLGVTWPIWLWSFVGRMWSMQWKDLWRLSSWFYPHSLKVFILSQREICHTWCLSCLESLSEDEDALISTMLIGRRTLSFEMLVGQLFIWLVAWLVNWFIGKSEKKQNNYVKTHFFCSPKVTVHFLRILIVLKYTTHFYVYNSSEAHSHFCATISTIHL